MTRVLIAVDDSDESVQAARSASELFGETAEYLVVNVAQTPAPEATMPWGYVMAYEPGLALAMYPTPPALQSVTTEPSHGRARDEALAVAEERATKVAHEADVDQAEVVAGMGDPAATSVDAAHEHHVDVLVVGSHDRSWFHRLFSGSVRADVVRRSDIPVLVVK